MTGFTHGPWTVSGTNMVRGHAGNTIADCRYKNGRADAHLIAAAPDMYAALVMAQDFIKDQYEDAESQALDGEYVSREARPVWAVICDALAKLEGKP